MLGIWLEERKIEIEVRLEGTKIDAWWVGVEVGSWEAVEVISRRDLGKDG